VPPKCPTGTAKAWWHGQGYLYPHDFRGHNVPQDYLPEEIAGSRFYEPGEEGEEPELVQRWREFRKKGKAGEEEGGQGGNDKV